MIRSVVMEVAGTESRKIEPADKSGYSNQRARVIIDLSGTKLTDRPSFLEGKLLKTLGVFSAEVNAFSNHMTLEFDPSIISLSKIKAMIGEPSSK